MVFLRAVGKARDTRVVVQSKKHSTLSRLITKGYLLVKGKKGDYPTNILLLVLRIVPFFVLLSITSGAFGHRTYLEFKTKHVFDSLFSFFDYTGFAYNTFC